MMKPISALAAVLLATAVVVPTVSQAADGNSVRISYADLNLANSKGQQQLKGRIAFAARNLCDSGARSQQLELAQSESMCRNSAIASAQPAFDAAVAGTRRGTVTVLDAAALIVTAR